MSVKLLKGDCLDLLPMLEPDSIDSCVTDPPYGLSFMGKDWDHGVPGVPFWQAVYRVLKPGAYLVAFGGTRTYHRMVCAIEDAGFEIRDQLQWIYGTGFPKSHNLPGGLGTALKPAFEPIVLARKPLSEGTVAANVLRWGTGALNIDGCRIHTAGSEAKAYTVKRLKPGATLAREGGNWRPDGDDAETYEGSTKDGRWPANVVHDGSDEVVGAFPESKGQQGDVKGTEQRNNNVFGKMPPPSAHAKRGDSGSAARFFYSAKASKADRNGSKHPTVKPIALMEWLATLITPPGGTVLDPFAGSGTTGAAARNKGFNAILIEREAEYQNDIQRREVESVDLLDLVLP